MEEEIKKLKEMKESFISFMNALNKLYKNSLSREVVFAAMITKKTLDILDALEYALKKYNITVQISLLRLLCDNCLAIQSAKELGLKELMDKIQANERVNSIMIDEEQNMSDGYLKRLVAEKYQGFDKVYKFACDSVHFSKQAMASSFTKEKEEWNLHIEIGNKEMKMELLKNNQAILTVSRIILDMLKDVCVSKKQ